MGRIANGAPGRIKGMKGRRHELCAADILGAITFSLVIASIFSGAEGTSLTNGCLSGWTPAGEMGCLLVSAATTKTPLTICNTIVAGAKAVKIENSEQNEIVWDLCNAATGGAGTDRCWIGLNDHTKEGVFQWASATSDSDGNPPHSSYDQTLSISRDQGHYNAAGYSDWCATQPRVRDGVEDGQADVMDNVYIRSNDGVGARRWGQESNSTTLRKTVCQMAAACSSDLDCSGGTPYCNVANGVCYACKGTDFGREVTDIDEGCSASLPFCNGDFGSCKECLLDRHCGASQVCNKGSCASLDANGCPQASHTYNAGLGCISQTTLANNNPSAADCSVTWPNSIPVTILSQSDQAAVYALCTFTNKDCWIGLNDIDNNNNAFRWWTRNTDPPSYNGPTMTYNNFITARPTTTEAAVNVVRNCVKLSTGTGATTGHAGGWNDNRCSTSYYPTICQMAPVVRQDLYIDCPAEVVSAATGEVTTLVLFNPSYVQGNSSETVVSFTCETEWGNSTTLEALLELPFGMGVDQLVVCTVTDGSGAFDTCEFNVTITPPGCVLATLDTEPYISDCPALNAYVVEYSANISSYGCLGDVDAAELAAALEAYVGAQTGCLSVRVDTWKSRRRSLLQFSQSEFELIIKIFTATVQERAAIAALLADPAFLAFLEAQLATLTGFPTIADGVDLLTYLLASARSDPHFVTQAGSPFDFAGVAGKTYCVVSSGQLAVNARMMGPRGGSLLPATAAGDSVDAEQGASKDTRTWMDQLAVVYGGHRVLISAESPQGTPYALSHGTITVDGELLDPVASMLTRSLPNGIIVSRRKKNVLVTIPGLVTLEVEVVRAAWWEVGKGPGANFLNFQVKDFRGSQAAHGILGQTLATPVKDAVVLEGRTEDYETSDIFSADCHFSRFNQE